ncbi:NF-kappa-B inhibitor cactus-like isoform X1 [Varroa destructor]|uniref:Uncharacterized protein n=1 Tax=Varroa destructor TaxID=109461 RepID=A0A7M7KFS7_VARDE|nr:NF-kappa-B inhibitor cactus-like isoform X1 [Varroa destructor]XP_022665484.1 NF-kappa-B inhibitor cactus-like isoform X1 [Varroa destructor]
MHLYLCNRRSQCCLDFHQFHCINSCQSVDVEKLKNGKMTPAYRRLKVAEKQFGFATNKRNVSNAESGLDSGLILEETSSWAFSWQNIYSQDECGDTVLHRMLASTAAPGKTDTGHHQLLLQYMRATPTPELLDIANNYGQTALHVACEHEDDWSARRLVLAGATADRPDDLRFTPLHIAAQKGNEALVRAITAPARADEISELGLTFYVVTPAQPRTKLVELNQLCSLGMTPLHLAVESGNIRVLEALLPFAGHANTLEMREGRTALQLAIEQRRTDMVRVLLNSGASIEQEDYAGRTAIMRIHRKQKLMHGSQIPELTQCLMLLQAFGARAPTREELSLEDDTSDDDDGVTANKRLRPQGCRPKDQQVPC